MIKGPVAINYFRMVVERRIEVVEVEQLDPEVGIFSLKNCDVGRPALSDDHLASTIDEETGVVSDAGADFDDRLAGQRQSQSGQMLLPALVMPDIFVRPEGGPGSDGHTGDMRQRACDFAICAAQDRIEPVGPLRTRVRHDARLSIELCMLWLMLRCQDFLKR